MLFTFLSLDFWRCSRRCCCLLVWLVIGNVGEAQAGRPTMVVWYHGKLLTSRAPLMDLRLLFLLGVSLSRVMIRSRVNNYNSSFMS